MFRFSKYCRKIQAANSTYWNVLPDMISPNRSQLGERLEYVSEGTRNQFFRLPIWEGSNWDVKQVWARPMILDSRDGSWEKCELRKQVKDLLAHWRI
jgi:hypothetical protein